MGSARRGRGVLKEVGGQEAASASVLPLALCTFSVLHFANVSGLNIEHFFRSGRPRVEGAAQLMKTPQIAAPTPPGRCLK